MSVVKIKVLFFLFVFLVFFSLNLYSMNISVCNFKKIIDISQKANNLDNYFRKRHMPLAGHGMKFVLVAEKYNLSYSFLPSISIIESTGGKKSFYCNPFGFGRKRFTSYDEAIEYVAQTLSEHKYYKGKSLYQKLSVYNCCDKHYKQKIFETMQKIENEKTKEPAHEV